MPQTLYLLAYDHDHGNSEDWNVMYTPTEIFTSDEQRQRRIEFLKNLPDWDMEFFEWDQNVMEEGDLETDPEDDFY
jgi:hypothetical protein